MRRLSRAVAVLTGATDPLAAELTRSLAHVASIQASLDDATATIQRLSREKAKLERRICCARESLAQEWTM